MTSARSIPTPEVQGALTIWAGVCVSAWISGLLVEAPHVHPADSSAEIAETFRTSGSVIINATLVHGLAAMSLYGMSTLLGRERTAYRTRAFGAAALGLSLVHLAGAMLLTFGLPADGTAGALPATSWQVWAVVNVADGLRLLAIAALIASVVTSPRPASRIVRGVSWATVGSLVITALGYLTFTPIVMLAEYVALPLLLVWAIVAANNLGRPAVEAHPEGAGQTPEASLGAAQEPKGPTAV